MKAYMGFSKEAGPAEGACLVFAYTSRDAKRLAYETLRGWWDQEFTDVRVRLLETQYLMALADPLKFKHGVPHVVESPPCCGRCEMWGGVLNEGDICDDCLEDSYEM